MNEKVLEGIIKLLAIIANVEETAGDKRSIISKFLKSHVNQFEASKSLFLYDEYAAFAEDAGLHEAHQIAHDLTKELSKRQRLVILLHLVELILADQEISKTEEAFILTVCKALHISEKVYADIIEFVQQNDATELKSENILLINDRKDTSVYQVKHYYHENLESTLAVLRFPHIEMYFLRLMLPTKDLFINGDQLNWEHIYPLATGTTIQGSDIRPIYYSNVISNFLKRHDDAKVVFEANNITYYFPNGGRGLYNINIAEESGTLVAVMGASGSGKSTLMNVLNSNLRPQIGTVKINGIDIYRFKEDIQGTIGYVPQDDLLIEDLSVYQNMFYAAKLCFGKATDEELNKKVKETLRSLGLYEIRDLRVGNSLDKTISGGQRKRLNIGLELLRQPSILFVDEPTSGLSSRDSENIIELLRQLTLMGKLIFVIIHQPSSDIFKMFDKLVILDVGGYQIYYGNPIESLTYFRSAVNHIDREEESMCPLCENIKVEEIFKIIENKLVDEYGNDTSSRKVPPNVWYNNFREKAQKFELPKVLTRPPSTLDIPSRIKQWKTFVTRDLLAKLRNRQYLVINLLQGPFLAFILAFIVRFHQVDELTGAGGYIFSENQNIPSYIFMSVIVALFMGLTVSAEEIIKDARILQREVFLELSRASYLFSKIFILFGLSAIQTLSYVLVGNLILDIQGMTLTYWLVLFSISCFSNMLGLNISATFNSVITIYILIPILLIPQLILGGIVVKFDEINPSLANKNGYVPLIAEIIGARWAFEALMVSQFKDNRFEKQLYPYDKLKAISEFKRLYYIPTLESKLDHAHQLRGNFDKQAEYEKELTLLQQEISKELINVSEISFKKIDHLSAERFNVETLTATKSYLDSLFKHYNKLKNAAIRAKDKKIAQLIKTLGRDGYKDLMTHYRNERITTIVTNTQTKQRIIENNGQLIQKIYPIYLDPPKGKYELSFNAHFYAPQKFIFNQYIPTLYFNVLIIWMMSLLLYITLYLNVFRQVLHLYDVLISRLESMKRERNKAKLS